MKKLVNQTLLYDDGCPLCSAYTTGFVKTGMLDANGRKPYAALTTEEKLFVDTQRACNEIALVDNYNKTVTYGIDSLLKVIGNSYPIVEKIGNCKPVNFLLKKFYSFISYNRKVIMPNTKPATGIECLPDFSYRYRIAYITFATFITAGVLYNYSGLITAMPAGTFNRELLLAMGQMVFQGMFITKLGNKNILSYFGNLITVSLFGSILLLPMLVLNNYIAVNQTIILGWFLLTAAIMFAEHYRRVTLLQLPHYLCLTWVAYRLIALVFILNLHQLV